ncbi:MAG TPA: hypothetical protein VMV05_09735 [bacterium]|nr:hypothetical protein [bacterium]
MSAAPRKNFPSGSSGVHPLLLWVPATTLGGGILAALVVLHIGYRDFGVGLGLGSVFFSLYFFSLKILTEKVLRVGEEGGRKIFWFWNGVRWLTLVLACVAFLKVSPQCLGGAFVSYFWFLFVFSLFSWRAAKSSGLDQSSSNI